MHRQGRLMRARAARGGFTLIELMIAIVLSGIVLGAMYKVLANNQRFYRGQAEVSEVHENLRSVAAILPAELREISPGQGDLISMTDSNITIRAMRVFGLICAPPVPATGVITVKTSTISGFRAVDLTRDSILVFHDGDSTLASDDRWLRLQVTATSTANCTDGSAGTTFTLAGTTTPNAAISNLDSVYNGAPVHFFERVKYSLYADAAGTYWLGVQSKVNGTLTAISPVAGPLRGIDGLKFVGYDNTGAVAGSLANVASIGITARGKSNNQIDATGRPYGYYYDSLTVRTAVRN